MRAAPALLGLVLVACGAAPGPTPSTEAPAPPSLTTTPSPAGSDPDSSATPSPTPAVTPEPSFSGPELAGRIDPSALLAHLEAFQRIADDAGGNRATGTPGFEASLRYVGDVLTRAGHRLETQPFEVGAATSANLIVEVPGEDDGVIMLGAHLDSVAAGPGINDNGSGVAALLELALALRELPPPPLSVRFAFWGAEEGGPFGSAAYLAGLTRAERDEVVAYLNFDMLGSPNPVAFAYDEPDAAVGSELITAAMAAALEAEGLAMEPIDLEGDSDHGPFVEAGIPTGGLFSGGMEPVTDTQAQRSGTAVAGQPADPCSHRACDTIDNVDLEILSRLTRVIADVLGRLAVDGLGT